MFTLPRFRRATVTALAVGAALASAPLVTAAPAAAQNLEIVALIPLSSPKFDIAQGAAFPVTARDSSAFSFAEQWVVRRNADGTLRFDNRLPNTSGQMVSLDVKPPNGPVGPTGGAVGTAPFDGSASQLWREQRVPSSGPYSHSILTNVASGGVLTFMGKGANPEFVDAPSPTSLGEERIILKQLG